jgi:hypothetical protein
MDYTARKLAVPKSHGGSSVWMTGQRDLGLFGFKLTGNASILNASIL